MKRKTRNLLWGIGLALLALAGAVAPLLPPAFERPAGNRVETRSGTEVRLELTRHAQERFDERKITVDQARDALEEPDERTYEKPGEEGGDVYKYTRRLDGRDLVIVAEARGDIYTLITGYWDD